MSLPTRFLSLPSFATASALALLVGALPAEAGRYHPNAIVGPRAMMKAQPNSTAQFGCELGAFSDFVCYGPDALRKAYGVQHLIKSGVTGAGETIVIIDAYGSPTAEADLAAFDGAFGLPPPPKFKQIRMRGSAPFDYLDEEQVGWAEESSLDVQWAHAMAPGANIVLVAAVSSSDADILDAQNYAIDHKLGSIFSESFGESELALQQDGHEGQQILNDNERSYRRARQQNISVFVSAGDDGAAGYDLNGDWQAVPVANYPASSPNVTSVGGTNLFFGSATNGDPNGHYQGEVVWNDGYGAGGGGISKVFGQPDYQDSLPRATRRQLRGNRGYPDLALNAGVATGVIVYLGFLDPLYGQGTNGYYVFGGTSASAPQWAGIAAIGNQLAGRPLGFINDRLYELGARGVLAGLMHDVTDGDNGFQPDPDAAYVPGFPAGPGWDLSTGWGTANFGSLLWLLADGH